MAESRPPYWAIRAERVTEPDEQSRGAWHVLLVTPGQENVAAAHLAGRGFGCYVPLKRAFVSDLNVIKACHPAPELAGYCLAFLWGSDVHRAKHCPGVTGVLCKANGEPAILRDNEVANIRAAEAANDALLTTHIREIELGAGRPARRKRPRPSRRIGKRGKRKHATT